MRQVGPIVTNSDGREISEGRYVAEEDNDEAEIKKEEITSAVPFAASVFPNPTKGSSTIKWNQYSEGLKMMVYDPGSNFIVSKDINLSEISTRVEVPVTGV